MSTYTSENVALPETPERPYVGWIVTCADHACRHPELFDARPEAVHWADWGHLCTGEHAILPARRYVAWFPRAASADAFAVRLWSDPGGNRAFEIVHRIGRRDVTWSGPATRMYATDLAENVGYYGSPPQGPVARLDGRPTPRCY